MGPSRNTRPAKTESRQQSRKRLEPLIEEATVDAYSEDEQEGEFLVMLKEHFAMAVTARVIGEAVEVTGFDFANRGQGIVAKVSRLRRKFRGSVLELDFGDAPPKGAEWVDAYRLWAGGMT